MISAARFAMHTTARSSRAANIRRRKRRCVSKADLVERFRRGAQLNEPIEATFYGGGEEGYTDYPTLDELERRT
jgi:hypothetical protein